jgi:hypothetical protein
MQKIALIIPTEPAGEKLGFSGVVSAMVQKRKT